MIRYGLEQMRHCQVRGCGLLCGPTKDAGEAHKIVHGHYPRLQGAGDGQQQQPDPDGRQDDGRRTGEPPVPPLRGSGARAAPPDAPT